jgi:hypothetical protein
VRWLNDRNHLAYAGRATVPDMTNASASGAAVRRASEEASHKVNASAKANTKASAKTKTRF